MQRRAYEFGGGYVPETERQATALVGLSVNDLKALTERAPTDADEEAIREAVIELKGDLGSTPYLNGAPRAAAAFVCHLDVTRFRKGTKTACPRTLERAARIFDKAGLAYRLIDDFVYVLENRRGRIVIYRPSSREWHWFDSAQKGQAAPDRLAEVLVEDALVLNKRKPTTALAA